MPRFSTPVGALAALALIGTVAAGCAGGSTTPAPSTTSVGDDQVAARRPIFEMTITGGIGAGTYVSDPASTLNYCTHAADGSWRFMYGGGKPWASVDLLFGARVAEPDGAGDVAAEITAGPAYLWMDQPKFRGGDAKGRSSAIVAVTADATTTTFHLTGSTPNRTPGGDEGMSDVDLTVTCPT